MILRAKFNKKNYLKYIGHLDLLRLFQRTFNRAGIPVKYSEGFNPHPKFSIANPLSLGIEGEEEYMDIDLSEKIDTEDFVNRMNHILPTDIQILDAIYADDEKSISSKLSWASYEIKFDVDKNLSLEEVKSILDDWLNSGEIMISRLRKKGKRKVMKEEDIRPLIKSIEAKDSTGREVTIESLMGVGDGSNLRPFDFLEALSRNIELGMDVDSASLVRKALYIDNYGRLDKPI